ncbi:hypothetical protein C8046_00650 [Serinibacter arcticus]|uniref:Uncharacterized protein n=1 Tax=Serinibacter arcticus TaxID=1655435 RepID=A0A2U1ZR31_9MICO|nr:hypothetical protein [Serinibacter arcticus]PWD49447.1 hypothetical protein C8046_00650 [Serinibacter arcticus]
MPLVLTLAACSTPERATPEELQTWLDDRERRPAAANSLGSGSGLTSPVDAGVGRGSTVSLTFLSPTSVDGVRVSCFGEGTLDFAVHVTSEPESDTVQTEIQTFEDQRCGQDSDLPVAGDNVTAIGFTASGSSREGAWSAEALGAASAMS